MTLALLAIAYGTNSLARILMGLLIEPIKAEFGASDAQMGLLTGFAFAMFYVTLGIPLGRLADRWNRSYIIAACLVTFNLATLACGFAWSFASLLTARICVAIGEAGLTPASTSLLADYFPPERRQLPMVILTVGGFLGAALGILGIGLLGVADQWRHVFMITAIPGLFIVPLILILVPEPRAPSTQAARTSSMRAIIELLRIRSFRRMAFGFAAVLLVASAAVGWMSSFLTRSLGFDQNHVFLFVALSYGVGGALGSFLSGMMSARLRLGGTDRPLMLCAAISLIFTAAFCSGFLFPGSGLALPALIVGLVIVGASQGPVIALIQDLVASDRRGIAIALLLFLTNSIGFGLGPLIVGALSDALRPDYGADSVRYALIAVILVSGIFSAAAFFSGSRSIKADIRTFGDAADPAARR